MLRATAWRLRRKPCPMPCLPPGPSQADVEALVMTVETAKSFYAKVEDGTYVLSTAGKEALAQGIAEAEKALKETSMSAMQEQASAHTGKLAAQVENAELWRGMIYPLDKARALADAITGLDGTEAYKQVVSDLDDAALTYERAVADVAALNLACRDAMTVEFLAKASARVSHRPDQLHQESEYLPDGRGHEDFGRMGCGRTWGIY